MAPSALVCAATTCFENAKNRDNYLFTFCGIARSGTSDTVLWLSLCCLVNVEYSHLFVATITFCGQVACHALKFVIICFVSESFLFR